MTKLTALPLAGLVLALAACGSGGDAAASSSTSATAGSPGPQSTTAEAAAASSAAGSSDAGPTTAAPAGSAASATPSPSSDGETTTGAPEAATGEFGSLHLEADGAIKDGKGDAMPTASFDAARAWFEARTGAGKVAVPEPGVLRAGPVEVVFRQVPGSTTPQLVTWTLDSGRGCAPTAFGKPGPASPFVASPVVAGALALGTPFAKAKAAMPSLASVRWSDMEGRGDYTDAPPIGDPPRGLHQTYSKCRSTATAPPDDATLTWAYFTYTAPDA